MILTGGFLFLSVTIGVCFQFSAWFCAVAILWSFARHLEKNFSQSMHKQNIKYESYSWLSASVIALIYQAVGIVFVSETGFSIEDLAQKLIFYIVIGFLVFYLPSKLQNRIEKEDSIQTSYICVFFVSIFVCNSPAVYLTNLLGMKSVTFMFTSQGQEQLPVNSQKVGVLSHILSHKDSRRIFLFLVVNFLFMFVEALYGYWNNSLGLISDAIHMCFDCTALAIGLYASYISKQPPDSDHPYGYLRYEILSGFINSIFLIFVGIKIFIESIERIMEIPEIQTDMLILVSVIGLLVNIIGLFSFHDLSHGDNKNLRGVFLHVLADTLGSVGVIISSILIKAYNWHIADPIASLIISSLILLSVTELIGDTVKVLMEMDVGKRGKKIEKKIMKIEGVESVQKMHSWIISGKQDVLMTAVKVKEGCVRKDVIKACKEILPHVHTLQLI
ncbi:hypothetical protein SteCoe_14910 [Stentor coeruleus]|uniref:Cation efflux protein transmembrane domain-containing protein n=1 Tax=Stentor coeruleus TaxID=5963 RepID=A0A1R2C4Y5_9CILI|nr:hypothetical protein SteCoe_14910 [Stentor coeruleus]